MLPDIQPGNTKILYFFNCLLDGMHTNVLCVIVYSCVLTYMVLMCVVVYLYFFMFTFVLFAKNSFVISLKFYNTLIC